MKIINLFPLSVIQEKILLKEDIKTEMKIINLPHDKPEVILQNNHFYFQTCKL